MQRILGAFAGLLLAATGACAMPVAPLPVAGPIRVEFFCSDGFAPHGGRCVATASRDEIELHEVDPYGWRRLRQRHRRHGLRTRY